jgi:hypothetical protein
MVGVRKSRIISDEFFFAERSGISMWLSQCLGANVTVIDSLYENLRNWVLQKMTWDDILL